MTNRFNRATRNHYICNAAISAANAGPTLGCNISTRNIHCYRTDCSTTTNCSTMIWFTFCINGSALNIYFSIFCSNSRATPLNIKRPCSSDSKNIIISFDKNSSTSHANALNLIVGSIFQDQRQRTSTFNKDRRFCCVHIYASHGQSCMNGVVTISNFYRIVRLPLRGHGNISAICKS